MFLKAIEKNTAEKSIALYLCSEGLRQDPRNHCVPILDTFEDEMELDTEFIVMPLLRKFRSPPFDIGLEAFDFVQQMLEVSLPVKWMNLSYDLQAVVFMHEHNVAHR